MKKLLMITAAFTLVFTMSSCSGNDNSSQSTNDNSKSKTEKTTDHNNKTDKKTDENQTNANTSKSDMKQKMKDLQYKKFELEATYPKVNDEWETELKMKDDGSIKAKMDDTINHKKKRDKDAFNDIYPRLKKLKIKHDTDKKEAIKQALEAFDLPSNYTDVELEITFQNGSSKEFNDKR